MNRNSTAIGAALVAAAIATPAFAAPTYVSTISIPGDAADLAPGMGANQNRLSIGSDLYYDRVTGYFYGLTDRGPGGGTIEYQPRIQQFALDVNPATGAISGFNVTRTIGFTDANGTPLTGLEPDLDPQNGSDAVLGRSIDSEGLVVGPNGHFFVSDEYGPAVREFTPNGRLVRTFQTPPNIEPRNGIDLDYDDGSPDTGRQGNRGFEGLAISPDNSTLFAVLQDPLQNEGDPSGRFSRNLRIVRYDLATGEPTGQFVYALDPLSAINGVADPDFEASAQGRNIGVSSIFALNATQFLLIERDNRGLGVEDEGAASGLKSVYLVDLAGATDVSDLILGNDLPATVTPVSKSLFLDVLAAFDAAGVVTPEKLEGLAIGPSLDLDGDGAFDDLSLVLATDNDYSVTQNGSNVQFDVCAANNGLGVPAAEVPIDSACPSGTALIPSFLYSFTIDSAYLAALGVDFVPQQVPAPAALALFGLGAATLLGVRRRRPA